MRFDIGLAIAVMLVVPLEAALAIETLPVIVSYEMLQKQKLDRLAARDPKAFWVSQIVARIEDKKPLELLALKAPVVVIVHFVVARDGRVIEKALKASSGSQEIDGSAIATLDRALPFPPMPPAMTEADIGFDMPIRFR